MDIRCWERQAAIATRRTTQVAAVGTEPDEEEPLDATIANTEDLEGARDDTEAHHIGNFCLRKSSKGPISHFGLALTTGLVLN